MSDKDVESRLMRWRPAAPPAELRDRLCAAVLTPPTIQHSRPRADGWFGLWLWQPWPLAYAGLLAVWALIFAFRALTPADPEPVRTTFATRTNAAPAGNAPMFAGTLAAERRFLLGRDTNLDQL